MTKPLILASSSFARSQMLQAVGLDFRVVPPLDVDESALISQGLEAGLSFQETCGRVAMHKALCVARLYPDSWVIGADQILYDETGIVMKARSPAEALARFMAWQGRTHHLCSCACVVTQAEGCVWSGYDEAALTMRVCSESFLRAYMDRAGEALCGCVGGYAIEEAGVWLFSDVRGDGFTIRGLPLIGLLSFLVSVGFSP